MALRLKLFGRPNITLEGDAPLPAFSNKALGLVYYLAVTRQPSSREALAGLLWSDVDEDRARRNLRVELSKLRPHMQTYLDIQRRTVAFDPVSPHWLDVGIFEDNLNRPEPTLPQIETAVALYEDDFLADFHLRGATLFEDWQLIQRERLRQLALDGLHKLIAAYTTSKQFEAGITAGRRLLGLEPWLESAHRQLMRLLVLNGQRSAALAQFEQCRQVLSEELGIEPSSETSDLHLQILNDEIGMDGEGIGSVVIAPPTPAAPPFQAPQLTQYFVGRVDESDKIAQQVVGKVGLIGLVGMGGIGKTTLATRMAHTLKDDFPDGVLWAASAQSEPLDILASWGTAYGYDFSGQSDVNNRAAAVRGMLADKRCLIVIDDVSSVARIRPLLAGGEQCATLLTTRSMDVAHGLEAAVLQVGELPREEGLELLKEILGEARVEAEADAAAEICAQLQNLPLALEIAAKRLKVRQRRKLKDMAKRLADMQHRLGLEISDHAVRASFEVSWAALDSKLKGMFALLATFDGLPFTAEALAAVAEINTYDAEDHLFSLVALSLVQEDGEMAYKQHPLLADFSGEKLAADDAVEEQAYGRMAIFYKNFAAENKEDYKLLEPCWSNFMGGIRVAHKQDNWPLMVGYLKALDEVWFKRGRFDEMRTAFHLAIETSKEHQDKPTLAWVYHKLGEAAFEQDEFNKAKKLQELSFTYARDLDDHKLLASIYYQLGHIHNESAEYQQALESFNKSEKIRIKLGDN
ncbi:MAG: BTAD domain-containing putative transcriptional regulator, partial [Chloroflexota bacterium]